MREQSDKLWKEFYDEVYKQKLDPSFVKEPVATVLAGPTMVIEAIVRTAVKNSGIPMDWGYCGGRAFVHVKGDIEKAREEVRFCLVQMMGLDT